MRGVHCVPQALDRNMRIDLRCRQAFVAQELLHGLQLRSSVEQVRGKAVPSVCGEVEGGNPEFAAQRLTMF